MAYTYKHKTEKMESALHINGRRYTGKELELYAMELKEPSRADWERELGAFLVQWLSPGAQITVSTSGSTGAPKQILLDKTAMIESAMATGKYFQLQKGNSALLCLSTAYIAGMMMVVRAMVLELELYSVPPYAHPLEHLDANRKINFTAMVPAQVQQALEEPMQRERLSAIGILLIGGAPVNPGLEDELQQVDCQAFLSYGMTETITHIAVRRINGSDRTEVYQALPGVSLSCDERSCLVISAPRISKTNIITNDLVELLSFGRFRWLGRADHIINTGGFKLLPEQVEKKLAGILPCPFFIASLPDERLGELPVLILEIEGISEADSHNLLGRISQVLERRELPRKLLYVPEFSRTASGKTDRQASLKRARQA